MKALYTHVSLSLVFQCEERSGPSASGSIGGASPPMRLAIRRPEPHAIVQPKVPCPALRNRLEIGVAPTIGVLSGVIGRNQLQKFEGASLSEAPGHRSFSDWRNVPSRRFGSARLKPDKLPMPPSRRSEGNRLGEEC